MGFSSFFFFLAFFFFFLFFSFSFFPFIKEESKEVDWVGHRAC